MLLSSNIERYSFGKQSLSPVGGSCAEELRIFIIYYNRKLTCAESHYFYNKYYICMYMPIDYIYLVEMMNNSEL